MNLILPYVDWLALGCSTVGNIIWAHNGRLAKYASIWWLLASSLWMWFSYLKGLPALGARDLLSAAMCLYGCYRWLRAPVKLDAPLESAPAQNTAEA